jgi:hypothetical protein
MTPHKRREETREAAQPSPVEEPRDREIADLTAYFRTGGRLGAVTGPGGIGKSHVCWKVSERLEMPGITLDASSRDSAAELLRFLSRSQGDRLVVVDEADRCSDDLARFIAERTRSDHKTHFLLSGRTVPQALNSAIVVHLAPWSTAASASYLKRTAVPAGQIADLVGWAHGNPSALQGAADCLLSYRDPSVTWADLVRYLRTISLTWESPPAEPSGRAPVPVDESVLSPVQAASEELTSLIDEPSSAGLTDAQVHEVATEVFARHGLEVAPSPIVRVSLVPDDLLHSLASDPARMRDLPSRRFEELIAELLDRRGYEVELTPETRDGGYDILARRTDDLAEVMFLVECKRYAEKQHVGVGLVRNLYGTVQQSRATGGILVTTSSFTPDAQSFQHAVAHQLQLHDYADLSRWLQGSQTYVVH